MNLQKKQGFFIEFIVIVVIKKDLKNKKIILRKEV